MAVGLEIRNAAGSVIFTTATRMGKVLGSGDVSSNGSTTVAGFSQGTGFVVCMSASSFDGYPNNLDRAARGGASISGTTLSWTGTSWNARTLVWGVF